MQVCSTSTIYMFVHEMSPKYFLYIVFGRAKTRNIVFSVYSTISMHVVTEISINYHYVKS